MTARVARFVTTRWSVVLAAGGAKTPAARAALETLCQSYWFPLFAYARRWGRDEASAEDAVQSFFGRLLAQDSLQAADPARGRFRSYLLTAFGNHLRNEAAAAQALKRGGGAQVLSLDRGPSDRAGAELRLRDAIGHEETPERVFEREWALALLESALARVEAGYRERGQAERFAALREVLLPGTDPTPASERAQALGLSPGALRVAVHRLRSRYREALLASVADTLPEDEASEEALQAELERLLAAL